MTAPALPTIDIDLSDETTFVPRLLASIDRKLEMLPPPWRQKWLKEQHEAWVKATARRAGLVKSVDDLDDHLRIIAGISARLARL